MSLTISPITRIKKATKFPQGNAFNREVARASKNSRRAMTNHYGGLMLSTTLAIGAIKLLGIYDPNTILWVGGIGGLLWTPLNKKSNKEMTDCIKYEGLLRSQPIYKEIKERAKRIKNA